MKGLNQYVKDATPKTTPKKTAKVVGLNEYVKTQKEMK